MKFTLVLASVLIVATPVNAQELANRVNTIDGNNDFGWLLPAGIGGAAVQHQLNQPMNARQKKPQTSPGQLRLNEQIMTRSACIRTISAKRPDGKIVGGSPKVLRDESGRVVKDPTTGEEMVICQIGFAF